jgi:hypothetical protein
VGVPSGDEVTLTVYGEVGAMPFEGSDTVRVNGWAWLSSRTSPSVYGWEGRKVSSHY